LSSETAFDYFDKRFVVEDFLLLLLVCLSFKTISVRINFRAHFSLNLRSVTFCSSRGRERKRGATKE
jgi:hypothetical protein